MRVEQDEQIVKAALRNGERRATSSGGHHGCSNGKWSTRSERSMSFYVHGDEHAVARYLGL
ncbi:hypothetical protein B4U45_21980 [Mycobacterium persicum]|uniref:Uncharacterized protein n=1 Tax=Mycobacterium persicum TaxID=1487726 RepID=A0A8E2IXB3_9MYCO|nr:hypothetical protein A4G31_20325 [Mycobacterium persicum]ORB55537.1 hypothetical protein BST40_05445 [Mycobacterium persicum]ORB91406.1 hypothetical protein B1T49_21685 [Mycobacterium persicum]ORB96701.1 hypothetical protein B1T44_21845 [Mycobacterium persicum]ORC03410.1 hypothetical protein B1T48_21405 [Mycobacterium persicum]